MYMYMYVSINILKRGRDGFGSSAGSLVAHTWEGNCFPHVGGVSGYEVLYMYNNGKKGYHSVI